MRHIAARSAVILAVILAAAIGPRVFAQRPVAPTSTLPAAPAATQPVATQAATQPLSTAVQLKVTGVERGPAPPPPPVSTVVGSPTPTPSSVSADLFIYVKMSYNGATTLHFYAGDIGLRDPSGAVQSPQPCDRASKLSSKVLMALSAVAPATASSCLRYSVSVSTTGAGDMALEYGHTEPTAQNTAGTPYVASALIPGARVPATPTPRRAYATATWPALRQYLRDEALVGGYIALNVDPLYAGGAGATIPTAARDYIARQVSALAGDHAAFLAVDAADLSLRFNLDTIKERTDADNALTALDDDVKAAATLRTNAQWAQWRARLTADNDVLDSLYEAWPATIVTP